jgi:peptidoglycan/LPS O-acetylase OafA/YrhL
MTNPPTGIRARSWSPGAILRHAFQDLALPGGSTIRGLDALRTLAILLVFSQHAYDFFVDATRTSLPIGRFPLFHFGWTGVDLFFVLSGFLIGKQLWRELVRTSTLRIGRFLFRRGMRIWPYYFSFILFTIALQRSDTWTGYWPDLLFLSNYVPGLIRGGWSLSTEEQFYLIVPVSLYLAGRAVRLERLWMPLVGLLAVLPLSRALALAPYGPASHADTGGALFFVTFGPIHTHADGLVAGLLLAWLAVVHPGAVRSLRFTRNLALPALLVAAGIMLRRVNPDLFAFTGLALIFGAAALFVLRDRSWITTVTRSPVFHVGSRLSYAMYLNHFLVLHFFVDRFVTADSVVPFNTFGLLGIYALGLVASMAIAAATFLLIESPFLQLRDALLRESGPSTPR